MEYCLSTVNEFLNDIRSFQKRTHIKRRNSMFDSGSSEQDEDMSTRGIRLNSSLDVNETVRGFVRQLLHALMVLHENNIVHCDVKGDNIFIANDGGKYIVKLGVSRFKSIRLYEESFSRYRILIYHIDLN
jgi:serine/threonine protein kinase